MSPAANTPGTLVIQLASRQTLPRSVRRTPSFSSRPERSGPRKPMARRTSSQGSVNSEPGIVPEDRPAGLAGDLDPDRLETADAPAIVAEEALRRDGVDALPAFLVRRRDTVDVRVLGPRVVGRPLVGRPRQDLHLVDRARALAVHRAEAVRARVAAAEDHHVLVPRRDEVGLRENVALAAPVLEREVLHREVDAVELAPRDGQVPRVPRAAGQEKRVVLLAQALGVHVDTHVGPRSRSGRLPLASARDAGRGRASPS